MVGSDATGCRKNRHPGSLLTFGARPLSFRTNIQKDIDVKKLYFIQTWVVGILLWCLGMGSPLYAQTPTVDLTTHQPTTAPPAGSTLEWHNALPVSAANLITGPQVTSATAGVYYAVYNAGGSPVCYSQPSYLRVLTNACPATTVDLATAVDITTVPVNATVTYHSSATPTAANQLGSTTVTAGATETTYYAAYKTYEVTTNSYCYSNSSPIVVIRTVCCLVSSVASPVLSNTLASNVCPQQTVSLLGITASNQPANTVLSWHSGTPATAANQITNVSALSAGIYYAAFYDPINNCFSGTAVTPVTASLSTCLLPLQAKVFLQGALFGVTAAGGVMRDDLRAANRLPASSPYTSWNAITPTAPISNTAAVFGVTGTDAIVDWVFVELRSPSSSTLVVDSRAALVQRDGDIVDVDGVTPIKFSLATAGNYYVAVRHRNHLGVMTSTAIPLSLTSTVVDFRNAATPTYRINLSAGSQPQVAVTQGMAMWAGNALQDKSVIYQGTNNDVSAIALQVKGPSNITGSPTYVLNGYNTGDVNLDGKTIFQGTGADVNFIYLNVTSNHPGNISGTNIFIIREQLP